MSNTTPSICEIDGVEVQHAALLHRVGVDTVSELAASNGSSLRRALVSANARDGLLETLPPESMVVRWVARARGKGLALPH